MKIGFNEATAMKKSNLEMDLKLTEKYGYDYIEIRLDMLNDYLKNYSIGKLKNFFANSHVKPYAFNSLEDINFCYGEDLEKLKSQLEWACKIAKEIGNPYIIVVPTVDEKIKSFTIEEKVQDSVEILNKLADISEKYGVELAFEPIGFEHCAVNNIKVCWDIIQRVGRKSVGMTVDAFNLYLYDSLKDVNDLEQVDVDKIFVFHIDDSENLPLNQLDHCHRLWPGEGVIPLDRLLKILYKKKFDKIASIELFRPEYWELSPEENIRIGKEKTMKTLKRFYK